MTLGYSQVFGFPLTAYEVWVRLIVKSTDSTSHVNTVSRPITETEVLKTLRSLSIEGMLGERDGYYFFPEHEVDVVDRKKREALSQIKWQEVTSFVEQIRHIPWIQGVAVTGSLAVNSSSPGDDIDFMIITSPNRLWLSRVWISWLAQLQGKRRSWKREDQNSWCFNLWLSEDRLRMPLGLQTLYGAYELCQARWVYSQPGSGVAMTFLRENNWAKWYIPHFYAQKRAVVSSFTKKNSNRDKKQRDFSFLSVFEPVFNLPLTALNWVFYALQYIYMKSHMTREKVAIHSAFFHPRNTRGGIYEMWNNKMSGVKK